MSGKYFSSKAVLLGNGVWKLEIHGLSLREMLGFLSEF